MILRMDLVECLQVLELKLLLQDLWFLNPEVPQLEFLGLEPLEMELLDLRLAVLDLMLELLDLRLVILDLKLELLDLRLVVLDLKVELLDLRLVVLDLRLVVLDLELLVIEVSERRLVYLPFGLLKTSSRPQCLLPVRPELLPLERLLSQNLDL